MTHAIRTLDTIDIEGHSFLVAPEEEMVPVKPICDVLGIDPQAQRRRIERAVWAKGGAIMATPSAGGTQDTFCLPRQQVPMWLATIDASRIKDEEARAVVELFQVRCAEVLDAYWSGRGVKDLAARELDRKIKLLDRARRAGSMTRDEAAQAIRDELYSAGMVESRALPVACMSGTARVRAQNAQRTKEMDAIDAWLADLPPERLAEGFTTGDVAREALDCEKASRNLQILIGTLMKAHGARRIKRTRDGQRVRLYIIDGGAS